LSRLSHDELGGNLVAVILHGSLVSGDFTPGRSDIDLLLIVRHPIAPEQRDNLAGAVTRLARQRSAWVDYRIVTAAEARRPQRLPTLDFSVGAHPDLPDGVEIADTPMAEPDLLFEFSICREEGRSLVGPTPKHLIGEVPNGWLLDVGDAYLQRWQEIDYEEEHAELMVFTACRLWYRSVEGRHCSKSAAATWVIERAPDMIAVPLALQGRTTGARPTIPESEVMALLARVRGLLAERA
jgi:hypothetical protein